MVLTIAITVALNNFLRCFYHEKKFGKGKSKERQVLTQEFTEKEYWPAKYNLRNSVFESLAWMKKFG
jgi:hypothetical protein